mmetsp:Transcript_26357/g.63555  ORF Transcript_26357/g.63555 Transcript_26357/m.63555 type:complete len:125 (-) Transcript_26357:285-659(-)
MSLSSMNTLGSPTNRKVPQISPRTSTLSVESNSPTPVITSDAKELIRKRPHKLTIVSRSISESSEGDVSPRRIEQSPRAFLCFDQAGNVIVSRSSISSSTSPKMSKPKGAKVRAESKPEGKLKS